jgi:hypothetical protein
MHSRQIAFRHDADEEERIKNEIRTARAMQSVKRRADESDADPSKRRSIFGDHPSSYAAFSSIDPIQQTGPPYDFHDVGQQVQVRAAARMLANGRISASPAHRSRCAGQGSSLRRTTLLRCSAALWQSTAKSVRCHCARCIANDSADATGTLTCRRRMRSLPTL